MQSMPRHLPALRIIPLLCMSFLLVGCQDVNARFGRSLTAALDRRNISTMAQTQGVLLSGSVRLLNAAGRQIQVNAQCFSFGRGWIDLGAVTLCPPAAPGQAQKFELFIPQSTLDQIDLTRTWQINLRANDPWHPNQYMGGNAYGFGPFNGYQIGQEGVITPDRSANPPTAVSSPRQSPA